VVEYLQRIHGIGLKVRQAQRWIRRLGFSLRQPIYRYAQATTEGVEEFRKTVKKTPEGQEK
jgi:transposase